MTLIDTSAWVEALRRDGDAAVRSRVDGLLKTGRAVLCDIVILELWNGAHGEDERSKLRKITTTLERVSTTDAVWIMAHNLATTCRVRGITVPSTDLLIAATARVHRLDLLEADSHFQMIPPDIDS
ncbi:MAG: PIN domain-containing protein [Spirochaeta sp.]|nr:PIN domain-containing protein [Spirochaeta sp.]